MSNRSVELEIRKRRSQWSKWLVLFLFFIVAVIVSYFVGYQQNGDDRGFQQQLIDQQLLMLEKRKSQTTELKVKLAQLTQGRKIDSVAISEVKTQLKEQQQESLELREEIAFYRGIVSPSETKSGILIQRVELTPVDDSRIFHYQVVLTQVLKNERVARGDVEVILSGAFEGRTRSIPLQELDEHAKKTLKFRFKYFQMFEGNLQLPDGFLPHSVDIVVKPRRSKNLINKSFPWPSMLSEDKT